MNRFDMWVHVHFLLQPNIFFHLRMSVSRAKPYSLANLATYLGFEYAFITCLERDNAFAKKIPFSPAGRTRLARYFMEYSKQVVFTVRLRINLLSSTSYRYSRTRAFMWLFRLYSPPNSFQDVFFAGGRR
jgi:hypothetical protein